MITQIYRRETQVKPWFIVRWIWGLCVKEFTWQCSNCDRGSAIKMRCGTNWNIPVGCDLADSIYFIHSPCGPSHVLLPRVAAWLPSTSCVFLPAWKQTHTSAVSLMQTGKPTDRKTDSQRTKGSSNLSSAGRNVDVHDAAVRSFRSRGRKHLSNE